MLSLSHSVSSSLSPSQKKGVIIIEGHVQGLANTRALGREGIPVYVVDKDNCVAKYSKYCQKYFKCPDYQSAEFIDFLIELHKSEDVQGWLLLPSNDHAVYNIAKSKPQLQELYTIITEDLKIIEQIYNKRTLLKLAESIGVAIPPTIIPSGINPTGIALRYPLLIKGNNGLSFYKKYKTKGIVLENQEELAEVFTGSLKGINPEEYFIQEVLPENNKTVSVTVFSVKGEVHTYWMGLKLLEHPLRFGTATCCESVMIQELLQPAEKLLKALAYTGVCEIEFLKDSRDGEYKLIEINARTWLWVGLAIRCGINYPKIIYEYLYNNKIPNREHYLEKKIWLNLFTDLFYSTQAIFKGKSDLKEVFPTYRHFFEACWDIDDPLPFLIYGLFLIKFVKDRQ